MSTNQMTSNRRTGSLAIDRRSFVGGAGLGAAGLFAAGSLLSRASFAQDTSARRDILVLVFLRGGMDGLTLCVPYADEDLYVNRPNLAIRPPGQSGGAIDLDGFFGLAPAAAPLLRSYHAGQLAFVHASGSTDPSHSHFDAQKFMEFGIPNMPGSTIHTGWLGRHMQGVAPFDAAPLRGISFNPLLPRTLAGAPGTLPIADVENFTLPGSPSTAVEREQTLQHMYAPYGYPLGTAALSSIGTIDMLAAIDFAGYVPANNAAYPASPIGGKFKNAAALIKAQTGVECLEIEYSNWDFHADLGPTNGHMAQFMDQLARCMDAFHADLGPELLQHVTLVAMSEFGRRVHENASAGLDHGRGGCMLVMGGHIAGGQVMRQWPGLAEGDLDNGDLPVTIDYRDILSEILVQRLACTNIATVFPNYTPNFRGITV